MVQKGAIMISWYEPVAYMFFGLVTGLAFAGTLMFVPVGMAIW